MKNIVKSEKDELLARIEDQKIVKVRRKISEGGQEDPRDEERPGKISEDAKKMKKKCQEARRTPGKMKDARRGKMTPARAQRIMKKTEERSPLPLFSPARKMESDAGHEKRKLMLEGLRLGQLIRERKLGKLQRN